MRNGRDGIGFVVIGALMFAYGGWQIGHAWRSSSWPSVDGQVLASRIGSDKAHNGTSHSGGETFEGQVQYRYSVGEKSYKNDVVRIGQISTISRSRARATAERHPRGPAKVFYDPAKPSQSVLEPGLSGDVFLIPVVGLVFAGIGLLIYRNRQPPFLSRPEPEAGSETEDSPSLD